MDVDAVVSGILVVFLGVMLLLARVGIVSMAALVSLAPYILIVVGALAIYTGLVSPRIRQ